MKSTQRMIMPEGFLVFPSMEIRGCLPCCAGVHAGYLVRVVPVEAWGREEDLKMSKGAFRLSTRMLRRFQAMPASCTWTTCISKR